MRVIALAAMLAAAGAPLGTARADDAPGPLTWNDLLARLDDTPRVRQSLLATRAARDGIRAAGQVPNPSVGLRLGRGMPRDKTPAGLDWGVDATFELDWLATRGPRMREARASADIAAREAAGVRRNQGVRLARLFHEVAYYQQLGVLLSAAEEQAEALAQAVQRRIETGAARPTDSPPVAIDRARVRLGRERAESALRTAREALGTLLGWPTGKPLQVVLDTDLPPAPGPRDAIVARILDADPGLAADRAHARFLDARIRTERARRVPGLAVGAYFDRERDLDIAGALVQLQVPVWNWNTGAIRQARSEQAAQAVAMDAATREARVKAATAWERCTRGRTEAVRYARDILPDADNAASAAQRAFALGEASLIETLLAQRTLLDVRRDALAAEFQARTDCTVLDLMTGDDDGN